MRVFGALVVALVVLTGFLLGQGNEAAPTRVATPPSAMTINAPDLAGLAVHDINAGLRDGEVSPAAAHTILHGMLVSGVVLPTAGASFGLIGWAAVVEHEIRTGQVRGSAATALITTVEELGGLLGVQLTLPMPAAPPKALPATSKPGPPRIHRVVTPTTAAPHTAAAHPAAQPAHHPAPAKPPPPKPTQPPPPKPPHHHRHHHGHGGGG